MTTLSDDEECIEYIAVIGFFSYLLVVIGFFPFLLGTFAAGITTPIGMFLMSALISEMLFSMHDLHYFMHTHRVHALRLFRCCHFSVCFSLFFLFVLQIKIKIYSFHLVPFLNHTDVIKTRVHSAAQPAKIPISQFLSREITLVRDTLRNVSHFLLVCVI